MAQLIKVDGSDSIILPKDGKAFTLEEMQAIVGGYIQAIYLPSGTALVMDEEGKLKNKPRNNRATLLGVTAGIADDDFLVGDILVCNKTEFV